MLWKKKKKEWCALKTVTKQFTSCSQSLYVCGWCKLDGNPFVQVNSALGSCSRWKHNNHLPIFQEIMIWNNSWQLNSCQTVVLQNPAFPLLWICISREWIIDAAGSPHFSYTAEWIIFIYHVMSFLYFYIFPLQLNQSEYFIGIPFL